MPRVSAAVEELNEEDEELRKEFEEYGESLNVKITDKNRPLLVKKLNHLRARRRMSEKLSQSILKESSPKRLAASRGGRGKRRKTEKNVTRHDAAMDVEAVATEGDRLNETFGISDASIDGGPPAKQSKYVLTVKAHEGPYAVFRKRAAEKSMNPTERNDELSLPSTSGRTSVEPKGMLLPSNCSQNSTLPVKSGVQKRGRFRAVDATRVEADTVLTKISTELESADSVVVQKTTLPKKRNARTSTVSATAKLYDNNYVTEGTVAEASSLSILSSSVKATVPEETGQISGREQKDKPGKATSDDGEEQRAASRIPKLARFPTPAAQLVSSSIACIVIVFTCTHAARSNGDFDTSAFTLRHFRIFFQLKL